MSTGYYLQDNPNRVFGQFGWPRTRVSGVIGVHTTESGVVLSGPDRGVENTASWMTWRPDPGSYHAMADADSRLKLVHPRYSAWADTTNNSHGMSVSAAMNAARWRDLAPERAAAIVRNLAYAAADLVRDALAAGLLMAPVPARRITAAEAIKGSRAGFYGHGETNPGRRYDPGTNFDWDLFLATYETAIGGGMAAMGTTTTTEDEDDMFTQDDRDKLEATLDHAFRARQVVDAIEDSGTRANVNLLIRLFQAMDASLRYVKREGDDTLYDVGDGDIRGITRAEWLARGGLAPVYVDGVLIDDLLKAKAAKAAALVAAEVAE